MSNEQRLTKGDLIKIASNFDIEFDEKEYEVNLDEFDGWLDASWTDRRIELRRRRNIDEFNGRNNYYYFLQEEKEGKIRDINRLIKYMPDNIILPSKIYIRSGPKLGLQGKDIAILNVPALEGLYNNDGLIETSKIYYGHEFSPFEFIMNEFFLLFPSLYLPEQFIDKFLRIARGKGLIAIDTNYISFDGIQESCIEEAYWRGPIFNGSFANLSDGNIEYHPGDNELFHMRNIEKTDVCTTSQGNEKHLLFEEVPKSNRQGTSDKHMTKFLHTIVEISGEREIIVHIDGSVRFLNEKLHRQRVKNDLKKMKKIGDYKKLWLIEGEVSKGDWSLLVSNYFRGNKDINRFLDPNDK